ncbi:MAG: YdiU family protein [Planctomycetes bacterium]|nr:YdiU family protein [Planctomycetota bacterium]
MTASATSNVEISSVGWRFDNTYTRLPDVFYAVACPATVQEPSVSVLNTDLASELGLDFSRLSPLAAANLFSGQILPDGSQPIAQAYAGHQYGHFTMLGDGRAILLGEHRTPTAQLVDIQFKGGGVTRFSRRGDGRAALGPMLREYLISEAMWALGIPTTRSLAVVTTGEQVYRASALRGAILTRVAASHIRVGTFEYAAARQEAENLQALTDYTIQRHFPELVNAPEKYLAFLKAVIDRQASLIAQWQMVGFIHGVMNTDNMAISGETIDYGPCAFMNVYRPETVFSSIDRHGRYAYGNQPAIAQWNLTRFAETLLPLLDADQEQSVAMATAVLGEFPALFQRYWLSGMRSKLGLQTAESDDLELIQSLLDWMQTTGADFTNTFRKLSDGPLIAEQDQDASFQEWHTRWLLRLNREAGPMESVSARMQAVNPAVIPRNHQVEAALQAAEEQNDLSLFHRLVAVLSSPYELAPESNRYRDPPPDDDGYQTFCGT